jgi:hypothetical protein
MVVTNQWLDIQSVVFWNLSVLIMQMYLITTKIKGRLQHMCADFNPVFLSSRTTNVKWSEQNCNYSMWFFLEYSEDKNRRPQQGGCPQWPSPGGSRKPQKLLPSIE